MTTRIDNYSNFLRECFNSVFSLDTYITNILSCFPNIREFFKKLLEPSISFEVEGVLLASIFMMVLSGIIITSIILFRRPRADEIADEILQETIRRINQLISRGEVWKAFWLARIWNILDLWDWREALNDAEALVNRLISQGKLQRAYEYAK